MMNAINKLLKIYRANPVEITAVVLGALGYILYVSLYYSVEVLFLASFSGDVQIIEKLFNGTLMFKDLIRRFGEHGMLGYDILLLVNALLFKYSARFDLVVNIINVFICGSLIVYSIQKSVINKNISYYLGILIVAIVMFSTMQGSSATMETQVRLGLMFYLIGSFYVNKVIIHDATGKTIIAAVTLIFIGTNVFGTFYNFAGLPMVLFLLLIFSIIDQRINRNYYIIGAAYLISTVLYLIMYDLIGSNSLEKGSIMIGAIYWISHPIDLLKSIFAYNASAILGNAVLIHNVVPKWIYFAAGSFITGIYAYSVVLFIRTRMYEKTVLPVLLQGYTLFVLILAIIGRYQYADWSWGTNNWYHVHTKLGLAASIWIIINALSKEEKIKLSMKSLGDINKVLALTSFLIITCGLTIGIAADITRARHVRAWYQNIAKYMYADASEMPVDKYGNTPLLTDKSTTVKCLHILKKYKLSVFSNSTSDLNPNSELSYKSSLIFGNYYSDGWISKEIKAKMNTGAKGYLIGKIYLPNNNLIPNRISVFINGNEVYSQNLFAVGDHYFEVSCEKNKDVIVKIALHRSFVPKDSGLGGDQRELAAILKELFFE